MQQRHSHHHRLPLPAHTRCTIFWQPHFIRHLWHKLLYAPAGLTARLPSREQHCRQHIDNTFHCAVGMGYSHVCDDLFIKPFSALWIWRSWDSFTAASLWGVCQHADWIFHQGVGWRYPDVVTDTVRQPFHDAICCVVNVAFLRQVHCCALLRCLSTRKRNLSPRCQHGVFRLSQTCVRQPFLGAVFWVVDIALLRQVHLCTVSEVSADVQTFTMVLAWDFQTQSQSYAKQFDFVAVMLLFLFLLSPWCQSDCLKARVFRVFHHSTVVMHQAFAMAPSQCIGMVLIHWTSEGNNWHVYSAMLCWDSSTVRLTTAGEGQSGRCWSYGLCVVIASLISSSPSVAMSALSGWGEATLKTWWCRSRVSLFGDWALECTRQYWKQKQLSSVSGWVQVQIYVGIHKDPKIKKINCKSPWSGKWYDVWVSDPLTFWIWDFSTSFEMFSDTHWGLLVMFSDTHLGLLVMFSDTH